MKLTAGIGLLLVLCSLAPAKTALPVVYTEPGYMGLKPGAKALLDDGSCPKGQIKELTGGNMNSNPPRERLRRCIKDPR